MESSLKTKPAQSMSDFFARADVKALQDIQKHNPPNSREAKAAYEQIRKLAVEIGAEEYFD